MKKEDILKKPGLSWTKSDYEAIGGEPPDCIYFGVTEGESMDAEGVQEWFAEQIRCLSVIKEESVQTFDKEYAKYLLDLEYLASLGKISKAEINKMKQKELFSFGE
jgi:hypothetical protein